MARILLQPEEYLRLVKVARHGCARPDEMDDNSFALVQGRDGEVSLRVIDQVAQLTVRGSAETEGEFDACLPMRHLSAIAKGGSRPVSITLDSGSARARSGRMNFNIPALEGARMATFREGAETVSLSLDLPELIERVLSAAAADGDLRQGLDGVCLHAVGKRLRVVATNGVALRATSLEQEEPIGRWMITIPRTTARNIARLMDGTVQARISHHTITVIGAGIEICSRLLSPGVPEGYEQALVGPSETRATAQTRDLLEAVEAVTPFLLREHRQRFILCRLREGELQLGAADRQGLAALAPVPVQIQGEVPEFSLRAEEILPMLRDVSAEQVTFHFHIKNGTCQVIWLQEADRGDSRMIIAPAIGTWPAEITQQAA